MRKTKIAVFGEHPRNDADAFTVLLKKKYNDKVIFKTILRNLSGDMLLNEEMLFGSLGIELLDEDYDYVLCIKDLDALISDTTALAKRDSWFNNVNNHIENKGVFFLAVYEMEALILSDIDAFNRLYALSFEFKDDPMLIEKPKEFLRELTNYRYKTSHCSEIFEVVDFEKIYQNHKGLRSFQEFVDSIDSILELIIVDNKKSVSNQ